MFVNPEVVVMWNEIAEKAGNEVKKGSRISVIGKLNYRTYETQSGEKRYVTEIVAHEFEVIPREN